MKKATRAASKRKTPQQKKFAAASKEASRIVRADPRKSFRVEMRKLLSK